MLGEPAKQGTAIKGTMKSPEPETCMSCLDKTAVFALTVTNIEDCLVVDTLKLCEGCITINNYFLGDHGLEEY